MSRPEPGARPASELERGHSSTWSVGRRGTDEDLYSDLEQEGEEQQELVQQQEEEQRLLLAFNGQAAVAAYGETAAAVGYGAWTAAVVGVGG